MSNLQLYIREYFADFVGYVLGAKTAPDGSSFAFSYSSLHKLAISPRHFFIHTVERRYAPQPDKDTDAILMGKALHYALLECYCRGESMSSSKYRVLPTFDGEKTKEPKEPKDIKQKRGESDADYAERAQAHEEEVADYKIDKQFHDKQQAALAQHLNEITYFHECGYIALPPAIQDKVQSLIYALVGVYEHAGKQHAVNAEATRIFDGAIATEVAFSYICPTHQIPIRGYIDLIGRDADGALYFADLKSMRAVDAKSVFYAARDNGYDLQAYVYAQAIQHIYGERPQCGYLVCAGEGEHTNVVRITQNDMSAGRDKYTRAIATYNACCFEPRDFLKSYDFFNE